MDTIELVGKSKAIENVQRLIKKVAKTSANVMILGESGTGKELIARILHQNSDRCQGPFIPVNCAAIPFELFESELFGHEKGSFTGAHQARRGRFELAAGGTLFLDEIGDMPPAMQVKLLRVLQEKSYERVGGSQSLVADVRVIAATHQNLRSRIQVGEFREDLYYRLNVFPIHIPALRERKDDIPTLIRHFIQQYHHHTGHHVTLSNEAMMYLCDYEWPGNVRELANLIERISILFSGRTVELSDLSQQFFQPVPSSSQSRRHDKEMTILSAKELPAEGFDLKEYLANLEYNYITQALSEYRGIVAQAAKRLGLRRTTLVEKMKKYGMGRAPL